MTRAKSRQTPAESLAGLVFFGDPSWSAYHLIRRDGQLIVVIQEFASDQATTIEVSREIPLLSEN